MNGSNTTDIAFIAPFTIPSTNNSKLISLLSEHKIQSIKQDINENPLPLSFSIPTTSEFDASNIIESNNTRILSQTSGQLNNNQNEPNSIVSTIDENEEPKLLIEIDSIQPTNLQQQLSTIVLNNFPNLKNNVVEQVLTNIINPDTDKSFDRHRSFHWSQINFEFTDLKVIFVRFNKVDDAKWFVETYSHIDTLLPRVELIYSHQILDKLAEVPSHPSTIPESLKKKLKLILYTSKNFAKPKLQGLEELDKVMQSYSDYKVDYNDLIDVPNEMKEGIIRDIIKFRSRMLLIEKENRQKQIENERLVTKNKLNELFKGIETTEAGRKSKENQLSNGVVEKEDVVVIPEQYENLSDEQYEKMIRERETSEYQQKYQVQLANFMKQHASEKSILESKLGKLLNYETKLMDNKLNQIEELRNYEKLEITTMYVYRYGDYLKQRHTKRSLEMKLDVEDAAAEEKEHDNGIKHEPKVAQVKKQKLDTSTKLKLDLLVMESLDEDLKSQIHDKISNLVEEYLGIQDDFLTDVIKQHIEVSGFNGKTTLVLDLVEVLDEDAENLVDDLYQFAGSIMEK